MFKVLHIFRLTIEDDCTMYMIDRDFSSFEEAKDFIWNTEFSMISDDWISLAPCIFRNPIFGEFDLHKVITRSRKLNEGHYLFENMYGDMTCKEYRYIIMQI